MYENLKDIQDEILDEILDKKEESYYDVKDREFEFKFLSESEQKHLKDSTKHNNKLMKMLSKL